MQVSPLRSISKIFTTYKLPIILGSVSLLCILISIVLLVKSVQTRTPIVFHEEETASISGQMLSVDVAGAVNVPGVYQLALGSRVEDGITVAGGLSNDADIEFIEQSLNRAAIVKDGAKIYVPKKGKVKGQDSATSYNINPLLQRPGSSQNGSVLISVNRSSQSELEALPGIGPVTAQKIISNRPYMSLDELVSKKAMGTALYGKLKDTLSL